MKAHYAHVQRPVEYGIKFRSKLEARYARYLEMLLLAGLVAEWSYETQTFWFTPDSEGAVAHGLAGIRRGVTSYRPDFKVTWEETRSSSCGSFGGKRVEFHEVKGYMDDRSRVALERMKRYYPNVTVVLVTAADVKRLGY